MDLERQRRESFEARETMAAGWSGRGSVEDAAAPVREWLLRELRGRPGRHRARARRRPRRHRVLGRRARGRGGRVISSDRSLAMVEVGRRRVAELGLRNVEHRVLDAVTSVMPQ